VKRHSIRSWLLPPGTLRHRVLTVVGQSGYGSAFRQVIRFLVRKAQQTAQRAWWKVHDAEAAAAALGEPLAAGRKIDVFCLPIINWDFRFQRPQQLLTQFARDGHRVFYLKATFAGFGKPAASMRRISAGIFEVALPGDSTVALYRDELCGPTLKWSVRALRAFIQVNRVNEALCLVHHPFWEPLARWLNKEYGWKIVYDCLDDVTGFDVAHPRIAQQERQLAMESALVLCTSQKLLHRLRRLNPKCILVPNAADYEHFSRLPRRSASPLAGLPRPVVGYYGAISEWFDAPGVLWAARSHPDWSFVLIGDTWGADVSRFSMCDNITLLGEKPYADLPAYLSAFDVCTIPFLRIPLTQATNPVKFYEYLSTGKPIVAASLPDLRRFNAVIHTYSTPKQFVTCLETALAVESPQLARRRRAIAQENTWPKRYQQIKACLKELYGRKWDSQQ